MTESQAAPLVRNNMALSRFELDVEGHTAIAEYQRADGIMTFTHTEVAPALNGRGIASRLARGALLAAREQGLKVRSRCSFITAYLAKHPEFADLVA